ncbi:MAG TPA: fasciclin domain-containing protein, partial [Pyrinomonadaceae bacterium]|nr:fasciclin domain-containing protein [Pyrinomonadaceae bacterium]
MKKLVLFFAMAVLVMTAGNGVYAQNGGMMKKDGKKSNTIVDVAMTSADHTTLVTALKAAGWVEPLKAKGPYTVFAPTNAAFDMLPAGTVNALLKPENKSMLSSVLTYHVVAGNWSAKDVMKLIKKGNGKAMIKTVNGGMLTATTDGKTVMITDEKGMMATVIAANLKGSNG